VSTAVHAEWLKLRTAPGTGWLLAAIVAGTAALSTMADAAARCPAGGCRIDPVKTSLTGIYLGQAIVVVLAATAVSVEYGTGMIRVTFTAMPGRTVVLAAKAVVIAGLVLTAGAVAILGSVLAGRLILPGHGFTAGHGYLLLSPGDGPVLRASIGSVLYLALIGLLSLGAAAAVRDTATAIGTVLGLLYAAPLIAAVLGRSGASRHLQQIAPMTAGLAVQATTGLRDLPVSPWTGLGILAAWAAASLLAGSLLLHLRDA
jgi:ABC-2 type transport system permease protein